jgi:hypothetical protein
VDLYALSASDATHVYAVGDSGRIMFSPGNGTWSIQPSGTTDDLAGVFATATDIWAVGGPGAGNAGTILRSKGAGTWVKEVSNQNQVLLGVWGAHAQDVWTVGAAGVMSRTNGNGTWLRQASGTTRNLWSIWGTSTANIYAVGEGVILHWNGNGNWIQQGQGMIANNAVLLGVSGRSAGDVYAVGVIPGSGAVMYRSRGDGCWARVTPLPTTQTLQAVWANATDVYVATGVNNAGGIIHSAGGAWAIEPTGAQPPLYGITGAPGRIWAGGGVTGGMGVIVQGNP